MEFRKKPNQSQMLTILNGTGIVHKMLKDYTKLDEEAQITGITVNLNEQPLRDPESVGEIVQDLLTKAGLDVEVYVGEMEGINRLGHKYVRFVHNITCRPKLKSKL